MIKRISVAQAAPGMYVHDLNCSWLDHPFATNRFTIRDLGVIDKIRGLGIRTLYIDTDKGIDVAEGRAEADVQGELQEALEQVLEAPEEHRGTVAVQEERAYAEKIQFEASKVVTHVMEDVRLGKQIEVERVNPVVDRMVSSIFRNKDALLGLSRIRQMDKYTFEHSVSVAVLLIAFARELGLEREVIQQIGVGALLHDVGKIKVPDNILNKPGKLTEEEFAVMRDHVVWSDRLLADAPGISDIARAVAAQHHERYDGSGYPRGLKGDEISGFGQMAAIVDVYDAITADRCYHKGQAPTVVLRRLLEWSAYHFNPELVQRFIHCVGIYPAGTLVRLTSGRLALVLETGDKGPLYPLLRVIYDAAKQRFVRPFDIDLSHPGAKYADEHISGYEHAEQWGIKPEVFL